jgi:chemotaxis protein methyltransferase CheR
MTNSLEQLSERIHSYSGIVLGPARLPALSAAIGRVCPGAAAREMLELVADPRHGAATIDRLVDEITINETFFMRHRAELDTIPWARLLTDARRRGQNNIRVWSPACSSGEEAFSLAILALEALGGETVTVSVLATDIAQSCLARAAEAKYGSRSLRHLEPELRSRYFTPGPNLTSHVSQELRRHLRLAQHNLVRDPIPPAGELPFDVIVCRNVLIYFDGDTAARTASRLQGALLDSGVMVLGAADRLTLPTPGLATREQSLADRGRATARRTRPATPERSRAPNAPPPMLRASQPMGELELALADADAGRLEAALTAIEPILAANPLNTVALCIQGLVLHAQGDPAAALGSLRRAVYLDPAFARAAFELGRAQDALGDQPAAHRAYRQALEGREDHPRGGSILGEIDDGLADACRVRLAASAGNAVR